MRNYIMYSNLANPALFLAEREIVINNNNEEVKILSTSGVIQNENVVVRKKENEVVFDFGPVSDDFFDNLEIITRDGKISALGKIVVTYDLSHNIIIIKFIDFVYPLISYVSYESEYYYYYPMISGYVKANFELILDVSFYESKEFFVAYGVERSGGVYVYESPRLVLHHSNFYGEACLGTLPGKWNSLADLIITVVNMVARPTSHAYNDEQYSTKRLTYHLPELWEDFPSVFKRKASPPIIGEDIIVETNLNVVESFIREKEEVLYTIF